jgi:hypothetical protein
MTGQTACTYAVPYVKMTRRTKYEPLVRGLDMTRND